MPVLLAFYNARIKYLRITDSPIWRRYVCMGHIYLGDIAGIVIGNSIPGGEDAPKGCVCIEDVGTSAKLSFVEDQEATRFIILALPKYADRETIGRHCLDLIKPKSRVFAGYVRMGIPRGKCARHPIVSPEPITRNCCIPAASPKMSFDYRTRIDARRALDVREYPTISWRHSSDAFEFFVKNRAGHLTHDRSRDIL